MAKREYDTYGRYVQGSAAKKLAQAPARKEALDERVRRPQTPDWRKWEESEPAPNVRPRQRQKPIEQSFDVFSLLFMTVAVSVALYVCVSYIEVQHNIYTLSKQTAALESQINELRNLNDAAYNRINTALDLTEIYEFAVNKLGMVLPEQNQILTYETIKSELVRKYGDIPEEKGNILDQIIANTKN